MDENLKKQLKIFACKARIGAIDGIYCAKAGHPGGSLSICDLLSYLYNVEMNVDPKNPQDPKRDRLVLSKGHAAPALYATLALKGYFPVEDLKTLRKSDSYLQGHPNMNKVPGVDMTFSCSDKSRRLYQPEHHIHFFQCALRNIDHVFTQFVFRLVNAGGISRNDISLDLGG